MRRAVIQILKISMFIFKTIHGVSPSYMRSLVNRLALKSGIDGDPEIGLSRPANTAKRLNSVYMVASSG